MGPRSVDAGRCDGCDAAPRLLPTCGPGSSGALCRACALAVADDGWCDGHRADGVAARRWASTLPDRWADLVILWWVSTGELRPGAATRLDPDLLPRAVADALPTGR